MSSDSARLSLGKGRVLLVDDDEATRITLEAILGEAFDVATAATAEAAKELLVRQSFDVLVTDYEMPGDNGATLIRFSRERWPAMTPILLTGHSDYADVRDLQQKGHVLVLFKPVDPVDLLAWVKNSATRVTTDPTARPRTMPPAM